MRTTLDIDEGLLKKAKAYAATERTSLTRLIEEGLALRLRPQRSSAARRRARLPVYKASGGFTAAVADVTRHSALLDAADGVSSR